MYILGLLFIILLLIGLYTGISGHRGIDLMVEINSFHTPYYELGISFNRFEEGVEELTIGLIFFNITLVFYKELL